MVSKFELETFTFNGQPLRTVTIDDKPWFPGPDVARLLSIMPRVLFAHSKRWAAPDEVRRLAKADVRGEHQVGALFWGTANAVGLLSESALYKVLLRAQQKNPGVREFQDWVAKEVLPRIRKSGSYIKGEEKVALGEMSPDEFIKNQKQSPYRD